MELSARFKERLKAWLMLFDFLIGILVLHWYYIDQYRDELSDILSVTITAYRPIPAQTDSSPNWTSIGQPAIMGICAVSQDLLQEGTLHYGDLLIIPELGVYKIADTMNPRHKLHIDILVYTKTQERIVGWRKNVLIKVLSNGK